jgi:hypothetical protein
MHALTIVFIHNIKNKILDIKSIIQCNNKNKNKNMVLHLATCELYSPCIHGQDSNSSPDINGHFLCGYVVSLDEIGFNPDDYPFMMLLRQFPVTFEWRVEDTVFWKQMENGALLPPDVANSMIKYGHPVIRNYRAIIHRRGIRPLELVELITLEPGGECVCIIKTIWLRIFQRRIKRWIRNKNRVKYILKHTRFLLLRECGNPTKITL